MISVEKDFNRIPPSLLSDTTQNHVKTTIEQSQYHKTERYKQDDIKEHLKLIYNFKCAYCEGIGNAQAPYHVEHYRPKSKVKEDTTHPGYYWLAYEWTNLLWSCYWCNQAKSSQFPINQDGLRIFNPPLTNGGNLDKPKCKSNYPDLLGEQPLILNPELDTPENHILFLTNGTVWGITNRGTKTIEICDLNRPKLTIARKKIIDTIKDDIVVEVTEFLQNPIDFDYFKRNIKKILSKLYKSQDLTNSYSQLRYLMFDKFELFFIKNNTFDNQTQKALKIIYNEFKIEFAI